MIAPQNQATSRDRAPARVPFLDAVRGALACVVVACHVGTAFGNDGGREPARYSVLTFFLISGYVLALSYRGQPIAFMLKRFVRLWPLYAAAICCGYFSAGRLPPFGEVFWWPMLPNVPPPMDPPAWTLYMEAWATPELPLLFLIARWSRPVSLLVPVLCLGLMFIDRRLYFIAFFAAGASAAQFAIPWPKTVPRVAIWLGDISYSLYLFHWIVMFAAARAFGPWAAVAALPAVFAVSWLMWRAVEMPSISLSRWVGRQAARRLARRRAPDTGFSAPLPIASRGAWGD